MVKVAALRVCHRNVRILSSFVHGDQAGERIPRISFSKEKRVFQNLSIPLLAHTVAEQLPLGIRRLLWRSSGYNRLPGPPPGGCGRTVRVLDRSARHFTHSVIVELNIQTSPATEWKRPRRIATRRRKATRPTERGKAGRGNDGLLESLEKTVRLFFPPFPQPLEIDVDHGPTDQCRHGGCGRRPTSFTPVALRVGPQYRWRARHLLPAGFFIFVFLCVLREKSRSPQPAY
jgi:hypothetical protein